VAVGILANHKLGFFKLFRELTFPPRHYFVLPPTSEHSSFSVIPVTSYRSIEESWCYREPQHTQAFCEGKLVEVPALVLVLRGRLGDSLDDEPMLVDNMKLQRKQAVIFLGKESTRPFIASSISVGKVMRLHLDPVQDLRFLPRLIGSVVITVPSATWLWNQGPTKTADHGHGHSGEEHEEHEDKPDEQEEKSDDSEGDSNDEGGRSAGFDDSSDDSKDDDDQHEGEEAGIQGGKPEKGPIGEDERNEPPNAIKGEDNKFTSGDEGLKQGPREEDKTSQEIKSVDPEADEGKKTGPSPDRDQGHEGEEKGTRVTEADKKRKVSSLSSRLLPVPNVLLHL
jgi:hypothetical protein